MQVLQYLLDDVSDFFATQGSTMEGKRDDAAEGKGCPGLLKNFINYVSERERENFRSRRNDNKDSVTLTTIHQVLSLIKMFLFFSESIVMISVHS